MVEVGADVEMMRLEYSFKGSDWSIVRLIFSVFLRIFSAQNMGNLGPREIAIIPPADAYAHATLFSIGDTMPVITSTRPVSSPACGNCVQQTACAYTNI
jgi:hypothetical protein